MTGVDSTGPAGGPLVQGVATPRQGGLPSSGAILDGFGDVLKRPVGALSAKATACTARRAC